MWQPEAVWRPPEAGSKSHHPGFYLRGNRLGQALVQRQKSMGRRAGQEVESAFFIVEIKGIEDIPAMQNGKVFEILAVEIGIQDG